MADIIIPKPIRGEKADQELSKVIDEMRRALQQVKKELERLDSVKADA